MKNQELFNKTISILVKAYFDGYLEATDCAACAVGNLVSANLGYERLEMNMFKDKSGKAIRVVWDEIVWVIRGDDHVITNAKEAKRQVDSTGYTGEQLMHIELAFLNDKASYDKMDNFDRLMCVCDCLMKIHEATESEIAESKSLFIKQEA